MLRYLTAGESHGKALVVVVEGLPAGLGITVEQVADELARRRLGYGRGPRMRFERDEVTLLAGIRHGRTLGSPVAIEIANSEWERKWTEEMSPAPGRTARPLTAPRPGHADLAGMQKYQLDDARDVLERASARETAARVAAGALAKALLATIGVDVLSHVVALGPVRAVAGRRPTPDDLEAVDATDVRCFDPGATGEMVAAIKAAAKDGDSLGGVVEVLGYGLPVGLGSHVHWDRKLDARLAQALMSIQAVKGVELGDGFDVAARRGSEAHDAIRWDDEAGAYRRDTTRAGGVEGGMSTGELLVAHVAMKPLATLNRPTLATVDTATKAATTSFKERTDVTAVPAMGVVAETMTALILADEVLRKFGGDSVDELVRNHRGYLGQVRQQAASRPGVEGQDGRAAAEAPGAPDAPRPAASGDGAEDPLNWNEAEAFAEPVGAGLGAAAPVEPAALVEPAAHIVLVGMMGAGKTSVGRRLALALGLDFLDSDEQVEAHTGRSVREIFEAEGEAAFRAEERLAFQEALARATPTVIAAAGGVVADEGNRRLLGDLAAQGGQVVWLRADPAVLASRVGTADHRPLLEHDPVGTLERLHAEREPLYRSVATVVVDEASDGQSGGSSGGSALDLDEVVAAVEARLRRPVAR